MKNVSFSLKINGFSRLKLDVHDFKRYIISPCWNKQDGISYYRDVPDTFQVVVLTIMLSRLIWHK